VNEALGRFQANLDLIEAEINQRNEERSPAVSGVDLPSAFQDSAEQQHLIAGIRPVEG
jgi:hypothetical protein